jgi:hypothetical protein
VIVIVIAVIAVIAAIARTGAIRIAAGGRFSPS